MYNVLMILLHRPFVADGHLYNTSRYISVNSFISCATAASNIVHVLRAYDKAFSVRRAPYLISYATYVAATIHARIAAKRGPGSDAHSSLEACLAVFRENQETNWAVRRANAIVQNLMKRLGVSVAEPERLQIERVCVGRAANQNTPGGASTSSTDRGEHGLHSLDIDGIIQSFVKEHENMQPGQSTDGPTTMRQAYRYHPANFLDTEAENLPRHQMNDLGGLPEDPSLNWLPQHAQHGATAGEAGMSVHDLLYGFNGSALDSFPVLEWDGM